MSGAKEAAWATIRIGPFAFRPAPGASVATLIALAILIGLGWWQVERGRWKTDLIAAMEARLAAAPMALQAPPQGSPEDWRFTQVRLSGRYTSEPIFVFSTLDGVAGRRVVQAFRPEAAGFDRDVFVDRGFLAGAAEAAQEAVPPEPEGIVTVTGALRESAQAGLFTPASDAERRLVYARDLDLLAAFHDRPVHDFLIVRDGVDAGADGLRATARLDLRDNHREYALTWFGLAGALVLVYGFWSAGAGRLTWRNRAFEK